MLDSSALLIAFLGGILPSLVWLFFLLREDYRRPEPKTLIIVAFVGGMAAVPFALVFEKAVLSFSTIGSLVTLYWWALIEEVVKYTAAYITVLRRKENDEPVDNMIYLLTAALGFAAVENALFMLGPLTQNDFLGSLSTGNLRFIGSTLLHVVCSASIGIFMAYAFCKNKAKKVEYTIAGVILAIVLHTAFNFSILNTDNSLFVIFGVVWVGVVILLLFFERVKRINRTCVY